MRGLSSFHVSHSQETSLPDEERTDPMDPEIVPFEGDVVLRCDRHRVYRLRSEQPTGKADSIASLALCLEKQGDVDGSVDSLA